MRRRTPGQRADPSHVAVKPARPYPLAQLPQNPTFSTPLSPARHGTHRREALPVRLELCSPTRATRRPRGSQPAAAAVRGRDRGRFVAGRRAAATQSTRRAKGAGGRGGGATRRGERRGRGPDRRRRRAGRRPRRRWRRPRLRRQRGRRPAGCAPWRRARASTRRLPASAQHRPKARASPRQAAPPQCATESARGERGRAGGARRAAVRATCDAVRVVAVEDLRVDELVPDPAQGGH